MPHEFNGFSPKTFTNVHKIELNSYKPFILFVEF